MSSEKSVLTCAREDGLRDVEDVGGTLRELRGHCCNDARAVMSQDGDDRAVLVCLVCGGHESSLVEAIWLSESNSTQGKRFAHALVRMATQRKECGGRML